MDGGIDDFAAVLDAARQGDDDAAAVLFDAVHPGLLRYLRWHEPRAAEDLAADTWLAVAERLGGFEGDEQAFRGWVFAIARRRLADHRRRSRRRRTTPVAPETLTRIGGGLDPAQVSLEAADAQQAVARLVGVLSRDQAEVVLLRVLAGLGVEEVARLVGKRPGTVRVLQHRALRRLAQAEAARRTPTDGARHRSGRGRRRESPG